MCNNAIQDITMTLNTFVCLQTRTEATNTNTCRGMTHPEKESGKNLCYIALHVRLHYCHDMCGFIPSKIFFIHVFSHAVHFNLLNQRFSNQSLAHV